MDTTIRSSTSARAITEEERLKMEIKNVKDKLGSRESTKTTRESTTSIRDLEKELADLQSRYLTTVERSKATVALKEKVDKTKHRKSLIQGKSNC